MDRGAWKGRRELQRDRPRSTRRVRGCLDERKDSLSVIRRVLNPNIIGQETIYDQEYAIFRIEEFLARIANLNPQRT